MIAAMKREILLGTMCLAAAAAAAQDRQPNVVLVLTDDQGYGDMACHGNAYVRTPNIDRLYGEAVRLTNFHADATSSPSRAALMTGRYSSRTGVWHTLQGRSIMDDEETTIAQFFRENGYRTGIFGKWHLGDSYPYHPMFRGFEESVVHGGGGVGQNPDYWRNDCFDDIYMHNRHWEFYEGYCTDVWFDQAIRFIREHRDEPFFCYIPTNAPHFWYLVPDRYTQQYRDAGMSDLRSRFFGMITCVDENLGRLRDELQRLGIADNTIFIYMTDNGSGFMRRDGYFYNAGMRGGKASPYEGGHRVPCFIYYKDGKLTGGRDFSALTAHIDLLPTLMRLCDLTTDRALDLDGIDLSAQLQGRELPRGHRSLVMHEQRVDKPVKYRNCCVMEDNWRLVNGRELYDIRKDPGERTDLAAQHPEVVEHLRSLYDRWWEHVSERFDQYSEVYIGAREENPAWLTCHDWHSDDKLWTWNQDSIRMKSHGNGYWVVKAVRGGDYRITLRTYPVQQDVQMNVGHAKLRIGDAEWERDCYPGSSQVTFDVTLDEGVYRMQTWMDDEDGRVYGAPYAYVEYVE